VEEQFEIYIERAGKQGPVGLRGSRGPADHRDHPDRMGRRGCRVRLATTFSSSKSTRLPRQSQTRATLKPERSILTVVNCLTAGKEAIGGGMTIGFASLAAPGVLAIASNGPSGTTGWTGTVKNVGPGVPGVGAGASYTVHVICVDPS
jgi:hypothetical protein